MRARTSTVSIGRKSPVSGTLSSIGARRAVATSSDARATDGPPPPPGAPPPPLGPCAACAWSSLPSPHAATAASAANERTCASDLWSIGCGLWCDDGAARQRNRAPECARELCGREVQIDSALGFVGLRDE